MNSTCMLYGGDYLFINIKFMIKLLLVNHLVKLTNPFLETS